MAYRAYFLYGIIVLGLLGTAEYRGWSFTRASEAKIVPKSVRDNPGAYRSHYYGSGRYLRGK
ncbi:MAG: hypothetical protein M3081_13055 [Gemmatimonadota bacterium]|nr:hypothetical protein [Gemmatimonadota bacterium]